jgi:hypothetical protein
MRHLRVGTPGCAAAELRLLSADAAGHTPGPYDLPTWLRNPDVTVAHAPQRISTSKAQGSRLGMGALAAEELLLAFLLLKRIFSLDDSDSLNAQTTGFQVVLPTGHLLCLSCFTAWEAALRVPLVVAQLNITRSQPEAQYIVPGTQKAPSRILLVLWLQLPHVPSLDTCLFDLNFSRALWRPSGQNGPSPSLHRAINETAFKKNLLVRGHLRDLCYHPLHHLSASAAGPRTPLATGKWHAPCAQRELCDLYFTGPGPGLGSEISAGHPCPHILFGAGLARHRGTTGPCSLSLSLLRACRQST